MIDVCDHGRPAYNERLFWRGIHPCDDCHDEDWRRVRKTTVVGVISLMLLIWVPACLLLAGVFW